MLMQFHIEVTPFIQNARVVTCTETNQSVVIDPGGEAQKIKQALDRKGLTCKEIWLTHSHLDHCGGVKELKELTGAIVRGHPNEKMMRQGVTELCRMYGIEDADMQNCPEPEFLIQGGEELELGNLRFKVLFTPGHSPGHVSFYNNENNALFSGDVLFASGIGRTDLPGGSYQQLMQTIHELIKTLSPETKVYPGHGPETTLGVEAQVNPFIRGEIG